MGQLLGFFKTAGKYECDYLVLGAWVPRIRCKDPIRLVELVEHRRDFRIRKGSHVMLEVRDGERVR